MPAKWSTFIPNVTQILSGQTFKNPGAIANDPARIGSENNPNFGVSYVPLVTPSGRRDWGEALAKEYIAAINTSQTPIGATHASNPAADQALIKAYGEAFERLYRDGDLPLTDTKDADGNITKEGKESSEAFADLCPEPIQEPDPIEEEKKRQKKFSAFLEKYKDDSNMDLYKFIFSKFHCIEDNQPQDEIEKLIATKLIREFESMLTSEDKIKYYDWVLRLGSLKYKEIALTSYDSGFSLNSTTEGTYPYFNVDNTVKVSIGNAGYDWQSMVDNISQLVIDSIETTYPIFLTMKFLGNYWHNGTKKYEEVTEYDIHERIRKGPSISIMEVPWPYDSNVNPECPLSKNEIQIAYDLDNAKPKLLTQAFIAYFSYDPSTRKTYNNANTSIDESYYIYYSKNSNYIITRYKEFEFKKKWFGAPSLSATDTLETLTQKLNDPASGTLFKFNVQSAIDEKKAADICDENEVEPEIDYNYPSGDPYNELAQATITYWYAHLIQPFKPTPASLPALSAPPLGGIYIPIYYGGRTRLAKGLRRALNSGKSFNKVPATEPPAVTVATALAAVYALHLLEFKLIYLGGIPVPTVPYIPMIGFVPLAF